MNYNRQYQNLVERVEGCQLNNITSTVAMELYLGSIIEPIRKSIRNTMYFNSEHAPKTLSEAMQKVQNFYIKHLYTSGEDQQESTNGSTDILPEITVNKVNGHDNYNWYRDRHPGHESSNYSQDSWEMPRQVNNHVKKITFNQPNGTNSEHSNSSPNSQFSNQTPTETENNKSSQQPNMI